jgi:pimeloyl-ACP methyl ester carboxylesterase
LTEKPVIVLVPGAWHGSWVWREVINELTVAGWEVQTVDLPSVAETARPRFGLHDDAEAIRRQIEGVEGPVVVVAHSYGGVAASEGAAELPNVRHIMYLAAFQLDVGESVHDACGGQPPEWWNIHDDTITPRRPHEIFYADLDKEDSDRAIAQLKPESLLAFTETQTASAWRTVPSTYVVCEHDSAIPPAAQEQMSARATRIRRLATSHSPFLSKPCDVARLIADAALAEETAH